MTQNGPIVLNKFFWNKTLLLLSPTYWPFSLSKILKKILTADIESWGCAIFGLKMVHIPQFFFFRKKLLISFSSTYWPLSLCRFFKKLLQLIQSYEDVPFLGPKWPIFPNENSFRKPVNKPCSFHSCLSISQKSKSDINVLRKYWQLKNTEISLAEIHFWL